MKCKSQENAVFIAIHPTTYRSGGFLAHGVVKKIMEDIVHKQKPENDAEIMWKKYKKLSLKAQRIVNELVDYLAEY